MRTTKSSTGTSHNRKVLMSTCNRFHLTPGRVREWSSTLLSAVLPSPREMKRLTIGSRWTEWRFPCLFHIWHYCRSVRCELNMETCSCQCWVHNDNSLCCQSCPVSTITISHHSDANFFPRFPVWLGFVSDLLDTLHDDVNSYIVEYGSSIYMLFE